MNGYVLVKSYYGWGGDLAVLAEAINLASRNNLAVVVDWRGSFSNRVETENVFDNLFNLSPSVLRANLCDLKDVSKIIPDYWRPYVFEPSPYTKEHPLTKVSRDDLDFNSIENIKPYLVILSRESSCFYKKEHQQEICDSYNKIIPNKNIQASIEEIHDSWNGHPTIGVHFRHGNGEPTVAYPDIKWYYRTIDYILLSRPEALVFVSTDCFAALHEFQQRYGARIVSTKKKYLPVGVGGMHYYNTLEERLLSGQEAITDIWSLSKCDYFVGTKSFFSYAANHLAGNFPKEKGFWYVNTLRSFKPSKDLAPIKSTKFRSLFESINVSLDGIYIKNEEGLNFVYLQEKKLGPVHISDNIDYIIKIAKSIQEIRLY
ncbi:MAG: nodulation protein NodZ [Rhodoferax sp.]|uniref:nodulation protein NodZ n=1 Tax=Rhodoferax sp. TaxID=50421 RepID=UPI0026237599|nr:nodulation protein NodZ [Rhodoferax sp.]MDD2882986.1 nodulation protein NodZ [Rhodoferax sp.]